VPRNSRQFAAATCSLALAAAPQDAREIAAVLELTAQAFDSAHGP
jgi:hypothetical protein